MDEVTLKQALEHDEARRHPKPPGTKEVVKDAFPGPIPVTLPGMPISPEPSRLEIATRLLAARIGGASGLPLRKDKRAWEEEVEDAYMLADMLLTHKQEL